MGWTDTPPQPGAPSCTLTSADCASGGPAALPYGARSSPASDPMTAGGTDHFTFWAGALLGGKIQLEYSVIRVPWNLKALSPASATKAWGLPKALKKYSDSSVENTQPLPR